MRDNMLIHDFIVVTYKEKSTYDDIEFTDSIKVDDSIILYMIDTLNWIRADWNKVNNIQTGFNYYGVTLYYSDSLMMFKTILKRWVSIFQIAPEEFNLANSMELFSFRKPATLHLTLKGKIFNKIMLNNVVRFFDRFLL